MQKDDYFPLKVENNMSYDLKFPTGFA